MARTCFLVIRCTPEERDRVHALAQERGVSASKLLRDAIDDIRAKTPAVKADGSSLRSDQA